MGFVMTALAAGCATVTDPTRRTDRRAEVNRVLSRVFYSGTREDLSACMRAPESAACHQWMRAVRELGDIGADAPLDRYVLGQVVYSLVRLGAYDEALAALDPCVTEAWWCAVLEGFTHAEAGADSKAEAAYDRALAAMPDDEVCTWNDLSFFVFGKAWNTYRGESCQDRYERMRRLWWLVDPAWILPGNGRRLEHYNRMAWAALHDDALTGDSNAGRVHDGAGHSNEHHDNVIKYGMRLVRWDTRWTAVSMDGLIGVVPRERALVDPFHAEPDDWRVEPNSMRENYAPRFGPLTVLDDFQVAFFERGDSLIAALALPPEQSGFRPHAEPRPAMFLQTGPDEEPIVTRPAARSDRWLFTGRAPRRRYVVGVEAFGADGIGRLRFGHGLPHAADQPIRLSDPLLYDPPSNALPDSLEAALPLMHPHTGWQRADTMGVFIEIYGTGGAPAFPISVSLQRQRGLLARIGAVFGLGNARPVHVEWLHPSGGERSVVSITLDLRDATEGDYVLRVAAGPDAVAAVEKRVRIVED